MIPVHEGRCGGIRYYRTAGQLRWLIEDETGRVLADGAGWCATEAEVLREVQATTRILLASRQPGTEVEVARYLRRTRSNALPLSG